MYDRSEPMGVDLLELAEFINKIGGIEDLYMLEFENQRLNKMLEALGENPNVAQLADKIVWLEERVERYRSEIEIPKEDRMEITIERLRQIREKMTRQFHSIEKLKEEVELYKSLNRAIKIGKIVEEK